MITSIREGSKAIIQYILDKAVNSGNLNTCVDITDNELAKILDFDKSKRFIVCIQYLVEKVLSALPKQIMYVN